MAVQESHQAIKDLCQKFADQELAPIAAKIDHDSQVPDHIYKKMAENGFFGIFTPEEFGGAGMDYQSYSLMVEEVSRGCASCGVILSAHNSLALWPILKFGTADQKKKYLPSMASGDWIGCFCLSEPNVGSDPGAMLTFAEDKGDHYLLNGTKNWITNGKQAKVAVVFAKTKKTNDYKGVTAFIVDMSWPGVAVQKVEDKLGIKGSSTAQIVFEKVKVPKDHLLGEIEKGFKVAMMTLDGGRIGIAAQALGIARASFETALKYSTERLAFGKPICELQAIQLKLADMSTKIQASSLLIKHAGEMKDQGVTYTKEAAQAKLFASETAMWVSTQGIQVLGGNGYSKEYSAERHFRDAKITEIYEGTSEIQRLVIAGQEIKRVLGK